MINGGLLVCLSLLVMKCHAFPKGYMPQTQPGLGVDSASDSETVRDLGSLPTNHAVGLAVDPVNSGNLFYADETAVYQFHKESGESEMVAGQESSGLLSMRSPVDGVGTSASFKYITKLVSRPTALYIFDYDRLRKYDYNTKEVSTVVVLSSHNSNAYPIIGVVSPDETHIYWTGMAADSGHMVMSMAMYGDDVSAAERITGGPTMIGHMEITTDEQHLLLTDVDMAIIEKVGIADGEVSFLTRYGKPNFRPGAMAVGDNILYAINREEGSIGSYELDGQEATEQVVCNRSCQDEIENPFDIVFDETTDQLFVLDGDFHPSLPTYIFSIKSINLSDKTGTINNEQPDFAKLLQFYSNWFAAINHD